MRILGKGKTALAVVQHYPDIKIYDDDNFNMYDSNSIEPTIVSPGIPPYNSLVQATKNQISDYDLFLTNDEFKPLNDMFSIWISGTNGKTTTTQMVEHLLKDKGYLSGGNIGVPLGEVILKSNKLILETSSFTLHYTKYAKPNIYILLPVNDDHISWHGTFKEYENAKLKPLDNMDCNSFALLPKQYKNYPTQAKCFYYETPKDFEQYFNIDISQIKFNEPFLIDALLAMAVDKILNKRVDYDKINSFTPDAHRLEAFNDKFGYLWVNDSKATNVDATIQALKGFENKKIFIIIGGDDKGANLAPLFQEFKKYEIYIFTIGSNSNKLYNFAKEYALRVKKTSNLDEAIDEIVKLKGKQKLSKEQFVGLLSPACSSLDQYNSYSDRGNKFKKIIQNL